jgi:ferrous iron transport protein B
MLSSFACAIPGIMATRTIEDRRVRYLTIMIAPLMSCSARLPVYTVMIAACIPATLLFGFVSTQGLVLFAMYLIGVLTAAAVAFTYTKITGRTQKASFVMEMPRYQRPMLRSVFIRVYQRAKSFVLRAGTLILAISILIWAASYYPRPQSVLDEYQTKIAAVESDVSLSSSDREVRISELSQEQQGALLRSSYFGQAGKLIEPLFSPLGWDWKITLAALASFPAREVVISTLSTIYNLGGSDDNQEGLVERLREARWDHGEKMGTPVFTPATALSLMVFFALCCQCGATVMTIKQEMGRWSAALLAFTYMTVLAYIGAFFTYQIVVRFWS